MGQEIVRHPLGRRLQAIIGDAVHRRAQMIRQAANDRLGDVFFLFGERAHALQVEAGKRHAFCSLGIVQILVAHGEQAFGKGVAGATNANVGFAAILVEAIESDIAVQDAVEAVGGLAFAEKHVSRFIVGDVGDLHHRGHGRRAELRQERRSQKRVLVARVQSQDLVHGRHGSPSIMAFGHAPLRSSRRPAASSDKRSSCRSG